MVLKFAGKIQDGIKCQVPTHSWCSAGFSRGWTFKDILAFLLKFWKRCRQSKYQGCALFFSLHIRYRGCCQFLFWQDWLPGSLAKAVEKHPLLARWSRWPNAASCSFLQLCWFYRRLQHCGILVLTYWNPVIALTSWLLKLSIFAIIVYVVFDGYKARFSGYQSSITGLQCLLASFLEVSKGVRTPSETCAVSEKLHDRSCSLNTISQ